MNDSPGGDPDRHETDVERMDRNFTELLQELRVLQTGTQILAGFLLTLPFQSRFTEVTRFQETVFLVAVTLAFTTTVLLIAPVSVHRSLFRRHRKPELVGISHWMTRVGLVTLGLTLSTVLLLLFSVVVSTTAGWVAAGAAAVGFVVLWYVVPLAARGPEPGTER